MTGVTVWTDKGLRAVATTGTQTWYADEPLEDGGTDSGPTPMEMMLGSLGTCIVITVHLYANRKRWPLEKVEVNLDIQRYKAGDYPAYQGEAQFVHEIREKVVLHGDQLSDEQRERLMDIAKKCPVRRVLTNPTFFVEPDAAMIPEN
jgi:putative redox protein